MCGGFGGLRLCRMCPLCTKIGGNIDAIDVGEFRIASACDGIGVRFGRKGASGKKILTWREGGVNEGKIVKGDSEGGLEFGVGGVGRR